MKKFILLLLFISTVSVFSQVDKIYQEANQFYQNKEYTKSINSYTQIEKNGFESFQLYYNLGNAYFKVGEIGKAILYYEKSLKLEPGNEEAAYNLSLANARTVDKIKEVPQIFATQWWEMFLNLFTVEGWQLITIIFYGIMLLSVGIYFFTNSSFWTRFTFFSGFSGFGLFIISGIILFAAYNREVSQDFGILLSEVQAVKVSPDNSSNDAFVLHEGVKFKVEDKVGEWTKIKLADGKIGWLLNSSFKII